MGLRPYLKKAGLPKAAVELREAIRDLFRQPKPDLSDALPRVSATVECMMRHLIDGGKGKFKEFVNELIEKGIISPPLNNALLILWGYSSRRARDGDEVVD